MKTLTKDEAKYFKIPKGKHLNIIVNWADGDWKTQDNVFDVSEFEMSRWLGESYFNVVKKDGKIKGFNQDSLISVEYYLRNSDNEFGELVAVWNCR